jgi:hypothetical protein
VLRVAFGVGAGDDENGIARVNTGAAATSPFVSAAGIASSCASLSAGLGITCCIAR